MCHRELGRYFSRYDGVRYVPLAAVSERYPDPSTAESEDGETATTTAGGGRRTEAAGAEAGNTGGEGEGRGEGEAAGRVSVHVVDCSVNECVLFGRTSPLATTRSSYNRQTPPQRESLCNVKVRPN